ncbi:hypothetical protein Rhe02_97020 [Rhizocola hellebori]|uniref:Uncharacterized protein n=1 Tax=Rhizocola hellebori TaxID=1392758 RepID=A0A8J3VM63_9ACTN|nr:hypothetical protein Rhe02_97020 [Rhizocola hellebori]
MAFSPIRLGAPPVTPSEPVDTGPAGVEIVSCARTGNPPTDTGAVTERARPLDTSTNAEAAEGHTTGRPECCGILATAPGALSNDATGTDLSELVEVAA